LRITRCGKNLHSSNVPWTVPAGLQVNATPNDVTLTKLAGSTPDAFAYCELPNNALQGKQITLYCERSSGDLGAACCVGWLNQNGKPVGQPILSLIQSTQIDSKMISQQPAGAAKLCIMLFPDIVGTSPVGESVTFSSLHIDAGTFTMYQPYQGFHYDILPDRAAHGLPGYQDTVLVNEGKWIRRTGIAVFTGQESVTFVRNTDTAYGTMLVSPAVFGQHFEPMIEQSTNEPLLCSHLPYKFLSGDYHDWAENLICGYPDGSTNFAAALTLSQVGNVSSTAELRAWLADQYTAGTPFTVLYPLKNPIETAIAPLVIPALEGTNIVYTNQGILNVGWQTARLPGETFVA